MSQHDPDEIPPIGLGHASSSHPFHLSILATGAPTSPGPALDRNPEITSPDQTDHVNDNWPDPPKHLTFTTRSYGFDFYGIELRHGVTLVGHCARSRVTATSISVAGHDIQRTLRYPPKKSPLGDDQLDLLRLSVPNRYTSVRINRYIVVGVFNKVSKEPREVVVELEDSTPLSSALWRGIIGARGWRYFLSLKVVRGFGIYKVGGFSFYRIYSIEVSILIPVLVQSRRWFPLPDRPERSEKTDN